MSAAAPRPLDGLLVVGLEQAVAAPFATRQLADLGARVIKIERPGGGDFARRYDETVGGESSYFVWCNRSKESLTLDLKDPEARGVLERLLARADVFVQNLAPGATARLGLDGPSLRERHDRLIVCDITGYGSDGPWADRKAYDMLVQSEAGLVAATGTPDDPVKVGVSIADIAAAMYAYSGILAALLQRGRTGAGAHLEVPLFDALVEWMGQPVYYTAGGGTPPPRAGREHATIAPYGPFTCGDGSVIMVSLQNDPEWVSFCTNFLANPGVATDPRFARNSARVANRVELNRIVARRFSELNGTEAVALLEKAGVANGRQNTLPEMLEHPVLVQRGRWQDVATPSGTMRATIPPPSIRGVTPRMDAIPAVGEHTDAILRELGCSSADIAALRSRSAI